METMNAAWGLMAGFDSALVSVVGLSLRVSLSAVVFGLILGSPLGADLAIWDFRGKEVLVVIRNAMMALPPVMVGLAVYLLLSRAGPLGELGLLFTPAAMIIAQTILITPIIMALTREAVLPLRRDYHELMLSLDVKPLLKLRTLL